MHPISKPATRLRGVPWRTVAGVVVSLALAAPAAAQLPAPPVTGAGPFQIGGYGAITFTRPEHPEDVERIDVSELAAALIAWGQLSPRASYLVELDMAKRTTETWTGREADERLVPVRAYLELSADDLLRLRLGRFLTPVGAWNERHAEPLTWTPTRPLTTYRPFAKSLTGLLVAGEGVVAGRDWGYAAFWAPSLDLDADFDEPEESAFVHAAGARFAVEVGDGLTLGASAARLRRSRPPADDPDPEPGRGEREEDPHGRTLLAMDVRWRAPRVELTGEGTWLLSTDDAAYEGGVYGSAALRVAGPVWAVGRAESYRPVDGRESWLGYAGVTVRPTPRFVVKLGRQFSERPSPRLPEGWFLSFSSLF